MSIKTLETNLGRGGVVHDLQSVYATAKQNKIKINI